jgi:general secretion pathway protein F
MRYEVTALSDRADLIRLTLDAPSREQAQREATERGLRVVRVQASGLSLGGLGSLGGSGLGALSLRPARRFPLLAMSQELASLLSAGLSLIESLQTLADKEERSEVKAVLDRVLRGLSSGQPFSAALRAEAASFSPLFVATVKASEKTGDLTEALRRFVTYRTQIDAVRKKVVGALIYPVLLLTVGLLVTLFLLVYVVPRFASVYEDAGRDMPWLSQLLLVWGRFFQDHWAVGSAVLAALIVGGAYAFTRPAVRARISDTLWKLPAVGERLRVYQLARLYRTLGMLLESGLPVVAAMKQCGDLLPPQLRPRLESAVEALGTGQTISAGMSANGLTTPVALRMLRVGERTGRMGELMGRIALFHEEEMARSVEWFTRLFEPILMLLIGAIIGLIVVLMYLPVFELAGSLQ